MATRRNQRMPFPGEASSPTSLTIVRLLHTPTWSDLLLNKYQYCLIFKIPSTSYIKKWKFKNRQKYEKDNFGALFLGYVSYEGKKHRRKQGGKKISQRLFIPKRHKKTFPHFIPKRPKLSMPDLEGSTIHVLCQLNLTQKSKLFFSSLFFIFTFFYVFSK